MVQLADGDIQTREVLAWKGVHLLHARGSSCSQKVRIFLRLKGIPWQSHDVDLKAAGNYTPWYLGINPRGLVPCLVHDGAVHIESNDIIDYLESTFPEPTLIPGGARDAIRDLLREEDELHVDLRTLTFRYVIPSPPGEMKSEAALNRLRGHGGTIRGEKDSRKAGELRFWEAANRQGITDTQVATSAARFREVLEELDTTLKQTPYLLGSSLTVADIAWYVYATRLMAAGYPLHSLHEHVRPLVR